MSDENTDAPEPMPAREVYDRVADALSWAAERRAEAGAEDEAVDLLDAALAARNASY